MYTGVWECTIVPTIKVTGTTADTKGNAAVTDHKMRRINVGVWKNGGELAYSTANGAAGGTNMSASSYSTTGSGKCYGNGTNNAVLAYAVKFNSYQDYVETAQMRQKH